MKETKKILSMGFHHQDGFVPAWKQASQFIGKTGRIGTLPDVVEARLHTDPWSIPWTRYFTTLSAEYFGLSKEGKRILIVAHGIGPMATIDGILKAYSHEFKDKTRSNRGGRISIEEFRELENGFYGPVTIVDFEEVVKVGKYDYPFIQNLRERDALNEELLLARFGSRARDYIKLHGEFATKYHTENNHGTILNPYILKMGDADNCGYLYRDMKEGDLPLAHLLSIGALANVYHERSSVPGLICDVGCHEWWNGIRLLAIGSEGSITDIHQGVEDVSGLIHRNWQLLTKPTKFSSTSSSEIRFGPIMNIGDEWFVQYPKIGEKMDTYEPEFLVAELENIGGPVEFRTTIGGYHGFFKYGVREVKTLAPVNANAYCLVGDPEIVYEEEQEEGLQKDPSYHCCLVQFFRIKVDISRRIMRANELWNNYSLLMKLIEKED